MSSTPRAYTSHENELNEAKEILAEWIADHRHERFDELKKLSENFIHRKDS